MSHKSILGVHLGDRNQLRDCIKNAWLSIYNKDAIKGLKKNGISSYHSQMSLLIQRQVVHDISFKLKSSCISHDIHIEITLGINQDKHKNISNYLNNDHHHCTQKSDG